MKRLVVALAVSLMLLPTNSVPLHAFGQARSVGQEPGPHSPPDTSIRLPNGRTQREEILKADYEKTRQEAAELVKLAEQLQEEIQKNDRHVLSVATLKKAEDIEKLAKRIRSRMRK